MTGRGSGGTSAPLRKSKPVIPPPLPPKPIHTPPLFKTEAASTPFVTNTENVQPKRNDVIEVRGEDGKYLGKRPLQFGLWAHYMGYGSAMVCLVFGITAILWDYAETYECKVNGKPIDTKYILTPYNNCSSTYVHGGTVTFVCCDPSYKSPELEGYSDLGALYIFYAVFLVLIENPRWGFGLWFPSGNFLYNNKVSPVGILHIVIGIAGLASYATCFAGVCLIATGGVYCMALARREAGDGGRTQARNRKSVHLLQQIKDVVDKYASLFFNSPLSHFKRMRDEDRTSTAIFMLVYGLVNFIIFVYSLAIWSIAIYDMEDQLLHGTVELDCDSLECKFNRKLVRYGPMSRYAPWAKACGGCLNFNCAVLLLPVTKLLLSKLYDAGTSYNAADRASWQYIASLITKCIPLQKNINFHKIVGKTIFVFVWGHVIFHLLNLWKSSDITFFRFRAWKWDGTDFLTGGIISLAMFFIYTSASDAVKRAKFEIFFFSHHWFAVFFLVLLLHGPIFVYWAIIPVVLYLVERYLQMKKTERLFLVTKVEWIPPVLAIQFRPLFKDQFQFKEGQYLYLNCPYVSKYEWHPFTISSALEDLNNGPRIHLETGEEVVEVPRPANWPANAKWNKYCFISQDYRKIKPEFLLEKSETGYNDYVSVHIKVHGLDDVKARSWTRKLKEYIELMNPTNKFPFYFMHRDNRGDVSIGRLRGPDGNQILKVEGPHSAPAEHYTNYGTVMLIGAGIGLTPCVSVLCALTKYRWKKNFNPETLRFYWIVRFNEVESYQWLIHTLTELEYNLKRSRESGQVESRYSVEINIYVTAFDKNIKLKPLLKSNCLTVDTTTTPAFTALDLYTALQNPMVGSGEQSKCNVEEAPNRLQDIFIWNGRPKWNDIFQMIKDSKTDTEVGVLFCGAPVIGSELRQMCEKHSSTEQEIKFCLHKENF